MEEDDVVGNIVELIRKRENEVQLELDDVYQNFNEKYIKPLRRKLPCLVLTSHGNKNELVGSANRSLIRIMSRE